MAVPIPVAAAVPIPVAAAVPIPVAAAVPTPIVAVVHDLLSEGNGGSVVSAETKTLDGAPSIEAVVTAEKRPQSAAPPVVAAMIDLNFGAPQSSGADEDDFQDLFGDLSSDD
ncbi:hypothetical protein EVJ58_g1557 [Rhodofomes roseus]|uniref:Uncharacterized protein n=1 Tax=Rhodofomes roseus TaxID=34475 RepID=A0A4Y9Z0L3_9APHY|nr:hypothetical protein EVJ58_g1557 [Rhodofomes roseus]